MDGGKARDSCFYLLTRRPATKSNHGDDAAAPAIIIVPSLHLHLHLSACRCSACTRADSCRQHMCPPSPPPTSPTHPSPARHLAAPAAEARTRSCRRILLLTCRAVIIVAPVPPLRTRKAFYANASRSAVTVDDFPSTLPREPCIHYCRSQHIIDQTKRSYLPNLLPTHSRASVATMSNTSPNQKRNLKPTISAGAYSASPSQLTLGTDQLSNTLNQNPYQQYGYGHDPSAFTFQPQPQYRQHQIPQTIKTDYHPQQLHQQPQLHQLPSPVNSRKRRASELDPQPIPGSSNNNPLGAYGNPHVPFSAGPGGEVDLGLPSAQTMPSPLPKKGRTNTPWTPAEEQRLKTLRDAGSSWSEIAKTFPLRTEGSVKKHWYKVRVHSLRETYAYTIGSSTKQDMHYAEFAEDESAALMQAIKDYENNKWKVIGQKVGKPAKVRNPVFLSISRAVTWTWSLLWS
ncbi:hypothetical protein Q7P35_003839 [Cladosporium inversicolor]